MHGQLYIDMAYRSVTNFLNAPLTCFNLSFLFEAIVFLIVYSTDSILFVTFIYAFNNLIIEGGRRGRCQTHKPCRFLPRCFTLTNIKCYPSNFILDPPLVAYSRFAAGYRPFISSLTLVAKKEKNSVHSVISVG